MHGHTVVAGLGAVAADRGNAIIFLSVFIYLCWRIGRLLQSRSSEPPRIMLYRVVALAFVASASAFSAGVAMPQQTVVSSRGAVDMMAKRGKANPALFSTGISPKQQAAANQRKKAAEAANKKKVGGVNRLLPT